MKKGTIIEGKIESLHYPNKGVFWQEEEKITVKNALPGQRVKAVVSKSRHQHVEARLLEVLSPGQDEDTSQRCVHAGNCGSCLYQGFPYETQLAWKEAQVRELLEPVIGKDFLMLPALPSPRQEGCRNKMEFSFGDEVKDGPLTLGMHRRGSFYDIVTTDQCRIMDGDFRAILRRVLDYFSEKGTPYYHKQNHTGLLRHLLVRKTEKTEEILVGLVTTSAYIPEEDFVENLIYLPLEGKIAGILHIINDSPADAVINQGMRILYGKDSIEEELLGLRFRITPFSFFQTNSSGAEVLYSLARDWIGDTTGKNIYDLYSGTGTIAQILAPVAESVTGVEIVEEAVEAARTNAEANGLTNCRFLCGDVLKVLDDLPEAPDLLVLDPPRDGIHPKALTKILAYNVGRILYISCKPTSLARDLPYFEEAGYKVEKVQCVDMFPFTPHVETIVLLQKLNS